MALFMTSIAAPMHSLHRTFCYAPVATRASLSTHMVVPSETINPRAICFTRPSASVNWCVMQFILISLVYV